jgi:hypothetical protein
MAMQEPGMQVSAQLAQCIKDCQQCHQVCLETINYCLQQGGRHAEANHIRLLRDCAEVCQVAADLMIGRSEFSALTCGTCATACDRCAADCDSFGNDKQMQNCAQVCRRCSQSCRQMAQSA